MSNQITLSDWYLHKVRVDYKERFFEFDVYFKDVRICSYRRIGDNKYELANINHLPTTRREVASFAKAVVACLGTAFKEGTLIHTARVKEGYYGNLSLVSEVLLIYTRMVEKIKDKASTVPKGQFVFYTMVDYTIFDSDKYNDTREFVFTHPERDKKKLYDMIDSDAKKKNINMKFTTFAMAGVRWQITIEQFMALYKKTK